VFLDFLSGLGWSGCGSVWLMGLVRTDLFCLCVPRVILLFGGNNRGGSACVLLFGGNNRVILLYFVRF
jgi:hypothetical protein